MPSRRPPLLGLFLALLALLAQLELGALVPRAEAASLLRDSSVICHSGEETDDPAQPRQHDPADCALCTICVSLTAQPAPVLSGSPVLPPPRGVLVARTAVLPPATAPPAAVRLSAQPRAPPSLA